MHPSTNITPVPDFRSAQGLFVQLETEHGLAEGSGKEILSASVYEHESTTAALHSFVRKFTELVDAARPTPFHHFLDRIAAKGKLQRLFTMNIDDLDVSMPNLITKRPLPLHGPWPKTIQLHGTISKMECTKCHRISDLDRALFVGPSMPLCPRCSRQTRKHGLRPRFTLYDESARYDPAIGNAEQEDIKSRPDLVLVVGTSLQIPSVTRLIHNFGHFAKILWINIEPPPELPFGLDYIYRAPCDDFARWISSEVESD